MSESIASDAILKQQVFIKRNILDMKMFIVLTKRFCFYSKNTTCISKLIFVFNGKISLQILLHVPKTATKEQPLVLHTARHECNR